MISSSSFCPLRVTGKIDGSLSIQELHTTLIPIHCLTLIDYKNRDTTLVLNWRYTFASDAASLRCDTRGMF